MSEDNNPNTIHEQSELDHVRQSLNMKAVWSAPIPPPELVQNYNSIVPDLGTKLVESFLEETTHRRQMEVRAYEIDKQNLQHINDKDKRDFYIRALVILVYAILVLVLIAFATLVFLHGQQFIAIIGVIVPLATAMFLAFKNK